MTSQDLLPVQRCGSCDSPTGRCEEDSLCAKYYGVEDASPLCEQCYEDCLNGGGHQV
jgi:hypothetical protein